MTIPKRKELQKHQRVSGGFLLPVLLPVLLVFSLVFPLSYSKSEEVTSDQLLKNRGFEDSTNTTTVPEWTVEGDGYVCNTCGPFGGNAVMTDKRGGAISQSVDLFDTMTQDEVNNGFDLKYGADVYSYSNNATVPVCSGVQGQDCKDTFSITLTINDSAGNQLHQFEHEYKDISWTGWDTSTYDNFTSTVPSNDYTSAIATLRLYGIDEGFTGGGWGGPRADNVHLAVTYTTQATLDVIAAAVDEAMDVVNQQIGAATDIATEPQSFEITINDPIGNEVDSFTIELPAVDTGGMETSIEMAPVEVASIEVPTFEAPVETGPMETQTEVASIEVEMDNATGDLQSASSTESGTSADVEPEPQSESTTETESTEQTTEAGPSESNEGSGESEGADAQSDEQPEQTAEAESQEGDGNVRESPKAEKAAGGGKSKPKSVKQAKKDAKQKVARKIVKSMGDKGRYDSTNQIRTLVVMGALGNSRSFFSVQKTIPDIPNFFQPTIVPDGTISDNNAAAYYMIGGSSAAHNALVNSQYEK